MEIETNIAAKKRRYPSRQSSDGAKKSKLFVTRNDEGQSIQAQNEWYCAVEMLSHECLLLIFSHLDAKHLSLVVPQVCKTWYAISGENTLWKALVVARWQTNTKPAKFETWKQMYRHKEEQKRKRNTKLQQLFASTKKKDFIITNKFLTKTGDYYTASFDVSGIEITHQENGKILGKMVYLYQQGFAVDALRMKRISSRVLQQEILRISADFALERAQLFVPINCTKCTDRLLTVSTFYFCTDCSSAEPFVMCERCLPVYPDHQHPLRKIENLPRQ